MESENHQAKLQKLLEVVDQRELKAIAEYLEKMERLRDEIHNFSPNAQTYIKILEKRKEDGDEE